MGLIKTALVLAVLTSCGNDFLPFLLSKNTAEAFFSISFPNLRVPVPTALNSFLDRILTEEISEEEISEIRNHLRSNPVGRLVGLHGDLEEAGINFRDFDLAQHEPELHHGTGPVVYPNHDLPAVSRMRRSALSEEDWLSKAQSQYESRHFQKNVLPDTLPALTDEAIDQDFKNWLKEIINQLTPADLEALNGTAIATRVTIPMINYRAVITTPQKKKVNTPCTVCKLFGIRQQNI